MRVARCSQAIVSSSSDALQVVTIVELKTLSAAQLERAAELLVTCFAEHWPEAWPTIKDARAEVRSFVEGQEQFKDRFTAFAAVDGDQVIGWGGGIKEYDGLVIELHPLAVDPAQQNRGVGRMLVERIEQTAREIGALTMRVGTDDEDSMTSLSNADLYDDLPSKIANVRNLLRHPMGFYFALGYTIIGVVPDANGIGKPDIIMGKRL